MFVIPCRFYAEHNYIESLCCEIRCHHPDEEIIVVDSASADKSYFARLRQYNVIIEDIDNRNFDVNAYWHAFKKYPDRGFYYFMHDSTKVKANLDYLKSSDLTILAYFGIPLGGGFITKAADIEAKTQYKWNPKHGVFGPIFFAKQQLMQRLYEKGMHHIIAYDKLETGGTEAALGNAFEAEGYSLPDCALYGDILALESPGGRSGPAPHNTEWQYPVEKFYASLRGRV